MDGQDSPTPQSGLSMGAFHEFGCLLTTTQDNKICLDHEKLQSRLIDQSTQ